MTYRVTTTPTGKPALQRQAEVAVYIDGSGERHMSHVGWETIAEGDADIAQIHAVIEANLKESLKGQIP
jgi:hypothetical protein